ncbi:MAG: TonB-dependent siderophore receptor [unclassified Hahellaceae]|nr:TonB-dependent siderophore receptor [Hahellaceae bacterium]|tara:strand:+ start:49675 stop:52029 length:2355 start_codon:yes stop_codon:yes gene_type:complete
MHSSTSNKAMPLTLRRTVITRKASAFTLGIPALMLGGFAQADDDDAFVLDTMQVEERTVDTNPYSEPGAPYKAKVSGDDRRVKPLAETPQTINVFTQTQIKDAGQSDLKEVLAAQPGITLGTGENGNAFGDRYIIRGHEARSDVFVDSLRDPGMTTRETFATEQVEVTKGPSSTFAGRGSTGGAINSITKHASTEYDFNKAEVGVGTGAYRRLTLDSNVGVTERTALRLNLLHAYEEVPDREPADRERNGVALSGLFEATDRLDLKLDYYYLNAMDRPDLGTYIVAGGGRPVDDLPSYSQDQDFLDSKIEVFTFRAGYDIDDNIRLENASRYGTTNNGYVTTGARGTARAAEDVLAPGVETVSLSTHQGYQEVEYFANQLNLFLDTELMSMPNQFVVSAEFSNNNVLNGVYDVSNTAPTNCAVAGRGSVFQTYCLVGPDGATVGKPDGIIGRQISKGAWDSDYSVETLSLSLMDTVDITDQWSVFFGVRLDSFDYENAVISTDRTTGLANTTDYTYSDELWNGHLGVVYQITEQGNFYATYSTSANINGGESDLGSNCGYGGLCGDDPVQVTKSEPELTENIEVGTKWNIMNEKLLATAALFQITKDDVMESVGDDYATLGTLNTGENRVRGVELSLAGNLTDKLSTQFGVSVMEAEVLESYDSESEGRTLSNFAEESLYLQLRYQATEKFAFGGAATYSSEMFAGQPDSAAGFDAARNDYAYRVPSYSKYDLFASYAFTEKLSTRLNVNNVFDKDYYLAAYRSGAFTYIGDARNAQLALAYEF